jgi:hypothetical protein
MMFSSGRSSSAWPRDADIAMNRDTRCHPATSCNYVRNVFYGAGKADLVVGLPEMVWRFHSPTGLDFYEPLRKSFFSECCMYASMAEFGVI